jgi:hypothetical protein
MFSKRSSAINWILSGQLQFSYRLVIKNDNQKNDNQKYDMIIMIIKRMTLTKCHWMTLGIIVSYSFTVVTILWSHILLNVSNNNIYQTNPSNIL